jgi:hypothetical protein
MRRLPCCLSLTAGLFRSDLGRRELRLQLKHTVIGSSGMLLGPGTRGLNIGACALCRSKLGL